MLGSPGSSIVKIGYSKAPERRLWFLQVGSPAKLSLLATFDGGQDLEGALHRHFRACHVRGEWFDLGNDPVEAVRAAVALGVTALVVGPGARAELRALDTIEWRSQGLDWDVRFQPLPRGHALRTTHDVAIRTHDSGPYPSEGCPDSRRPSRISGIAWLPRTRDHLGSSFPR
ncbi:GIY-YIG nuclease family protein [Streptomyces bobili]|uniref:GIY-YIG nuclease family protein n=1 Tax=Streptomyces bobili TaxID=67280 RepID=UPI0033B2C8E9